MACTKPELVAHHYTEANCPAQAIAYWLKADLQMPLDPALVGGQTGLTGPIEGRPPGTIWAHQRFAQFAPQVAIEVTTKGATTNTTYNPGVPSSLNSGINPATPIPLKFHPGLPTQALNSVWTFNGTIPPKLVQVRYGEPVLFRHH